MPKKSTNELKEFLLNCEGEWEKECLSYYELAVLLNNIQIGAVSIYFDDSFTYGELG